MEPNDEFAELQRRVAALEDHLAILRTMYRYNHAIDNGAAEEWTDCFTSDATYEATFPDGRNRKIVGHDELRAFADHHPGPPVSYAKHVAVSPLIDVDGDEAVVKSVLARFDDAEGGPLVDVFGWYEDRLARGADGTWRFSLRHSHVEAIAGSFRIADPDGGTWTDATAE